MENKEQVKEQSQKKGNMWGGKGWIGNIVKNLEPVKTPEEHWLEVRSKIKSEYIPLFDKNSNPVFRHILLDYSKSKMKEIVLSLYHTAGKKQWTIHKNICKIDKKTPAFRACDYCISSVTVLK